MYIYYIVYTARNNNDIILYYMMCDMSYCRYEYIILYKCLIPFNTISVYSVCIII